MEPNDREQLDALLIVKAAEFDPALSQTYPHAYAWACDTLKSYAWWIAKEIEKREAPGP